MSTDGGWSGSPQSGMAVQPWSADSAEPRTEPSSRGVGNQLSHSNPLASPHFHTLLQVSTLRYQTFIKDPYYSQSIFCSAKIFFSFGTSWSHSKPLSSLSVYSSELRLIAAAHCSTAPGHFMSALFLPNL